LRSVRPAFRPLAAAARILLGWGFVHFHPQDSHAPPAAASASFRSPSPSASPSACPPPSPTAAHPPPRSKATVDIPYEQFTLPNGLRVVVHTDRKAPIVAVNLWYHVGSKDEPAGRSGFAHLFEHLMFQASENHKGEYFAPFKQVGVTDQNGTTNQDRTNYFENVPTTALDTALWMESDRMGHLLGAIDQPELDEQRGVVQNEKRQGENQPYGRSYDVLVKSIYPEGHPYHHTVIGSMNDLNAASLTDVKTWFRSWYGPNNAVLVLAGDIDLATAKAKVTKYFGDIPASATLKAKPPMIAARKTSTRESMTDHVAQTRVIRVWNVPNYASPEVQDLQLLAQVLGGSRASRLDKRPVLRRQDRGSHQRLDGRLRTRRHLRHHRRHQGWRGSGHGREGDQRGTAAPAHRRPVAGRAGPGAHRVQGRLHPRHRAHRRLRRQGRRAGRVHHLYRRSGLLPRPAAAHRHRHAGAGEGRGQQVAARRRPHPEHRAGRRRAAGGSAFAEGAAGEHSRPPIRSTRPSPATSTAPPACRSPATSRIWFSRRCSARR
jgi:predicted Zn-dependent peptidase